MVEKKWDLDTSEVVIKTALTPEQLAEYIGGTIESIEGNSATDRHVVFMDRAEFDADYKRRMEDLCERLDAVTAHVAAGRITKDAEKDVAWCLAWAMDQMQLMHAEQRKLAQWLMESTQEAERLRRKFSGSKGGSRAASHWDAVADEAVRLARERGFDDGRASADWIAQQIEADVRAFARRSGRDFPGDSAVRKISAYLRKAGIKKAR